MPTSGVRFQEEVRDSKMGNLPVMHSSWNVAKGQMWEALCHRWFTFLVIIRHLDTLGEATHCMDFLKVQSRA